MKYTVLEPLEPLEHTKKLKLQCHRCQTHKWILAEHTVSPEPQDGILFRVKGQLARPVRKGFFLAMVGCQEFPAVCQVTPGNSTYEQQLKMAVYIKLIYLRIKHGDFP